VITAMRAACYDPSLPGHEPARRIMKRQHFRMIADFNSADREGEPLAADRLADRLVGRFGESRVKLDSYRPKSKGARFPVLTRDGKIEWSTLLSATLNQVPTFAVESPRPRRRVLPGRMKKRYPRGRVFLRGGCWGVLPMLLIIRGFRRPIFHRNMFSSIRRLRSLLEPR